MKHDQISAAVKVKMTMFLIPLLLCIFISKSTAQNDGECIIPDISAGQWSARYTNDPIKDTGALEKVFVAESYIELASVEKNDYLNVVVVNSELIITTNENFSNYEKNEQSGSGDHVITIIINLICETTEQSVLNFRQPINDTNNNPPTFDSDSYTYQLPMPFPANLDIKYLGPIITVEDIDITNTHIYFTINTDDFVIETEGPIDDSLGKKFRAIVMATKALRYTENKTFILTATDTGTDPGPLSTNVTINIEVDTDNSYPQTPAFTKTYYQGSYNISNQPPIDIETISISEDYQNYESLKFYLKGDYSSFFSVVNTGRILELSLHTDLPTEVLENKVAIVLALFAEEPEENLTASATLILDVAQEKYVEPPKFTKSYYIADYYINAENEGEISTEDISINYEYYEDVDFELEGDYKEYFQVVRNNDNTAKVTVVTNLVESILEENTIIILIIVATVKNSDSNGTTVLIISLPTQENPEAPSFTKLFYSGSYNIADSSNGDNNDEVEIDELIQISEYYKEYEYLNVAIKEEECNLFFSVERIERSIFVSVKENLPDDVVKNKSHVVLTILAYPENDEELIGSAILIISLPTVEESDSPSFTKLYYSGSYIINDGIPQLSVEHISLVNNYDDYESVDIFLEEEEYNNYFNVLRKDRNIEITLRNNDLPESILKNQSVVVLTIVARSTTNLDLIGYTIVIISLPEIEDAPALVAPSFTKPYYNGNYTISDENHQIYVEQISISPDYSNIELIIVALQEEDYDTYLSVKLNERSVELSLQEKLPDSILERKFLVLTIVASVLDNNDLKGHAVAIISLPEGEEPPAPAAPPNFTKTYYTGNYTIINSVHEFNVEEISISTDYEDFELVTFKLQEYVYQEYFNVTRDERNAKLELSKELSKDILQSKSIALTIVASIAINDLESFAVVIISLPESDNATIIVPPSFTKPYYNGTYMITSDEHELNVDEINISSDYNAIELIDLSLNEEEYREYVTLKRNENYVLLELNKNLHESLLKDKSIIVLTIIASVDKMNGYTVVLLSLIDNTVSSNSSIEFEQDNYKFIAYSDRTGVIGAVKAVSTIAETISYRIVNETGNLLDNFKIDSDTGVISNTDKLKEANTYNVVVYATGKQSKAENSSRVEIYVNVRSTQSALVKHVIEEEENTDIFVLIDEYKEHGLWYEIYEQYPTNGTDLFKINSDTGNLDCVAIDREASIISNMYLPQFTVTLRLHDDNMENNRRKRSLLSEYSTEERTWVYIEDDLPNLDNQTVVFVVIDDINDNAPVFINVKQAIGYPTFELALEIFPPYVTVVEATDPDEGYNASIQFSSNNIEFYIHSTSGVVYPTQELFNSDSKSVTLRVTATDRNGTGLSNTLTTEVVLLEEDEISILSIEGSSLEDVDSKLSELSSLLDLNIGYLIASVVATSDISRIAKASTNFYLNIIAYALDSNNKPVSGKTLEDSIKNLELNGSWSIQSWESYKEMYYKAKEESSSTGLLVAVIILAILVLIFVIAVAGTVYYLKYRRPNYATMIEDRASPIDFKKEPKLEETIESPYFTGFLKNTTTPTSSSKVNEIPIPPRRPTGLNINGATIQQVVDDDDDDDDDNEGDLVQGINNEIPAISSNEQETLENPKERKKSVAFNENVERMELEGDEIQSTDL